MGCNLCTFQKREEHYKLLYEVSQVSAGSLIPKQLNSQPGFVFVWKMVNELWLALCFLSVDFRIKGRLAGGGLFILVLGGSFQLSCHSPFRWLPVGFFLTFFFLYLLPRCQSSKRSNTEIHVCHILRHLSFWNSVDIWKIKCIIVCINIRI